MHFKTNKSLYKYNLLLSSCEENGDCGHKGQLSLRDPRNESRIRIQENI